MVTDWLSNVQQPLFKSRVLITGGETRTEVVATPEVVTLDKWFREIVQPYFSKKQNQTSGETRTELDITPSVVPFDWLIQIVNPYFKRSQLNEGWFNISFIIEPTPPTPPVQEEVDGVWKSKEEEYAERRKKQLLEEDDLIFHVIKIFIERCL